jgi:hypothetical protein
MSRKKAQPKTDEQEKSATDGEEKVKKRNLPKK